MEMRSLDGDEKSGRCGSLLKERHCRLPQAGGRAADAGVAGSPAEEMTGPKLRVGKELLWLLGKALVAVV
jgi:hypothetical protein